MGEKYLGASVNSIPFDEKGNADLIIKGEYIDTTTFNVNNVAIVLDENRLYLDISATPNKQYRFNGTNLIPVGTSLSLGETNSTAYRGDKGKEAYDHSQLTTGNPHNVNKSDVGLGNVPNTDFTNAVALNTAKETNATHTGDVTGATVLTITPGAVTKTKTDAGVQSSLDKADSALQASDIAGLSSKSYVDAADEVLQTNIDSKVDKITGKSLILDSEIARLSLITSGDKYYLHVQGIPSNIWTITHNLGKIPSVTITDSAGTEMDGEITFTNINTCILSFSAPFSGFANLN